jgi:predicted  nucleic acid-binding Zn-ribbon protein
MEIKKGKKSTRLKNLEGKLKIIEKSKHYLEKELLNITGKKRKLEEKIRKEKEAIAFSEKARKLRH